MAKEVKAGSAFIEVNAKLDKLHAGMEESKRVVEKGAKETESIFSNTFGKLKNIGMTLGLAFGANELISFAKEAVIASAKLEVLRANFRGTAQDIELFKKATAGTVTEANLIKLSNQASDLGISLKDQAILFSLAEDSADKYGTSVEEGMMKVIAATEGSTKGLKALGIQKAVYEDIVKSLAKAQGDEFKNLDAEIQKQIQVQAILKATGLTIEDVADKTSDAADRIEQFYVGIEELKTGFGELLREGFPGVIEALVMLIGVTATATAKQNELNQATENDLKLRKMQTALYKDTVNYVGDLAENEAKGKSSSQLTSMIATVQEKISNMKRWAQKSGFTDDTKNDLAQQTRRLNVYQSILDMMQEKDAERSKKLQEQKDKDLAIEKEYYAAVGEAGLVSIEQILENVDKEVTERYNKLSSEARKEIDLEKWKTAERIKAEEEYYNKVIKNSPAYKKSEALVNGKNKPQRAPMEGPFTLGDSASRDGNPFVKFQKDITEEIDRSTQAEENFADALSNSFNQGIQSGETMGEIFVHTGEQFGVMILQALEYKAIMAALNLIPGVGSVLSWLGIGGRATGGPVAAGVPYEVGEKGREIFVPDTSGFIVPNSMVQSINASSSISNSFSFNDGNIVGAIAGLDRRISALADRPIISKYYLDSKLIAVEVTKHQNNFDHGNVKFRG